MSTRKTKLLIWLVALSTILACAVPSLSTPIPPLDPGAVNTFIAETVNAASTETVAARPSSTPTATFTPTPRNTETPTPTATVTVIFILSSPTPLVVPTSTGLSSGGGSSSDNFACQVISHTPANGTSFSPRADFDAVWTVKNIGKKNWDRTSIDYAYSSGAILHTTSTYDLSANVKVGETIDIIVDMKALKDPGSYSTTWVIRSGSNAFCNLSLSIIVK